MTESVNLSPCSAGPRRNLIELGPRILRASFTRSGVRIFLVQDSASSGYRVATRWTRLAYFKQLQSATDIFEGLKKESCEEEFLQQRVAEALAAQHRPASRFGIPLPIAVAGNL